MTTTEDLETEGLPGLDGPDPDWRTGEAWTDPELEPTTTLSLFEGDEGGLDVTQRRCLVTLLKHRFITSVSHPREWQTLVSNPAPIRSRLNDVFLLLHLDTDREVAFKKQAVSEGGGRFPTLLYDTPWNREETILMVFLRARTRADDMAGITTTFVDRADLIEHLAAMRPAEANDQWAETRKASAALDRLHSAGLILGKSTDERLQVSPALDAILPLEKLAELLAWLRTQNEAGSQESSAVLDPDSPSPTGQEPTTQETTSR